METKLTLSGEDLEFLNELLRFNIEATYPKDRIKIRKTCTKKYSMEIFQKVKKWTKTNYRGNPETRNALKLLREAASRIAESGIRIERAFLGWLDAGGFPEAQGLDAEARGQLLRDYVDVAMLRDVVERHGVSNVIGLRWLVRHLLSNAAGLFSVEKFYAALKSQGIAISKDTVHQLLGHLEDCFLVRVVWMESVSERQRPQ